MQPTCANAFDLGPGGAVTDQYGNAYPLPDGGYGISLSGTYTLSAMQFCEKSQVLLDAATYNALLSGSSPGDPSTPSAASFTSDEVAALKYMAAHPSPFTLSLSDGVEVSGLIVIVWATAWAVKAVARALQASTDSAD